jgi:hypothetical protein
MKEHNPRTATKTLGVRFPSRDCILLEAEAEARGMTVSQVIRWSVREMLKTSRHRAYDPFPSVDRPSGQ